MRIGVLKTDDGRYLCSNIYSQATNNYWLAYEDELLCGLNVVHYLYDNDEDDATELETAQQIWNRDNRTHPENLVSEVLVEFRLTEIKENKEAIKQFVELVESM